MASPEEQYGQIIAMLSENSKGMNEVRAEMRSMKTELLTWKPKVDNRVHEMEHAVLDLGERVDKALGMLLPQAEIVAPTDDEQAGVTIAATSLTAVIREEHFASPEGKVPSSAHLGLHPPRAASGSLDHGKRSSHRGLASGWCTPLSRAQPRSQVR
jgi:hypothetical protein